MLDLVPLRGAGWVVADGDLETALFGEAGKLDLQGLQPVAVRATGIGPSTIEEKRSNRSF